MDCQGETRRRPGRVAVLVGSPADRSFAGHRGPRFSMATVSAACMSNRSDVARTLGAETAAVVSLYPHHYADDECRKTFGLTREINDTSKACSAYRQVCSNCRHELKLDCFAVIMIITIM